MKAVIVEPGEVPYVKEIDSDLTAMQDVVGGYIEALYPFEEQVAVVCNEEGKLLGLPLNRALRDEEGNISDIIAGTFFICSAPSDSECFESLTDQQIEKYSYIFSRPEMFVSINGHIITVTKGDEESL